MRTSTLPSPGNLANGLKLRTESAKAISFCEVVGGKSVNGHTDAAGRLAAYFTACAATLTGLYETVVPTVSSRIIANTEPSVIRLTFSEHMDRTVAPALAAFTLAGAGLGGRTITSIAWISPTVLGVTLSAPATAGIELTIAYLMPSINALRDLSANRVVTFTAAAITNNVA
jgi:ABC-type enterochelin transport system permease subunit